MLYFRVTDPLQFSSEIRIQWVIFFCGGRDSKLFSLSGLITKKKFVIIPKNVLEITFSMADPKQKKKKKNNLIDARCQPPLWLNIF